LEEVSRDHPHLNHNYSNEEDISQTWKDTNSDLELGGGEEGSGEVHNETESEDNISAVTDNMFPNNYEDNNSVPERAPEKQTVSYKNTEEREELVEQEEQCILPVSVHHPFENQEQPHHTAAAHNHNHANTHKPACQYDLMENYLQHITMNLIKLLIYIKPWESTRDAELEVNVKTKMNSLFSPFRRLLPSFLVEVMQCYVVLNGFFIVGMIFLGLYEMKLAFWLFCLPIKTTMKILNTMVRLLLETGPTGLIKKLADLVKSIRENGPSVLLR
jgi:hypothetical protein